MTAAAICQAMLMLPRSNVDPFANFVRSLLHFEGDLTDSADPTITWGFDAGAALTGTPGDVLAGAESLSCQTSSSDRISATGTQFDTGTSDFCAEIVYRDDNLGTKNEIIFLFQGIATSQSVRLYSPAVGAAVLADASGGGPAGPGASAAYSTPHHAAITRSGSNWTLWLDGASVKTWTNGTFNTGASGTNVWLGSGSSGGSGLMCILDEWRLTVGTPRYTAPFTPSYPFPNP